MTFRKTTLMLLAVALSAGTADAGGGFLQKLPKDGTWVEYNLEMKSEVGGMLEMTGIMKVKSVGTATENGEKYRWFEIEFQGEQNGMKQRTVIKALIREKDLKPGAKTPLKILRGWQQGHMGDKKIDAKELTEVELSAKGPFAFFFRPQLKNVKTVKKAKTIDYQNGRLKIASATTGDVELKFSSSLPKDFKQTGKQTVWKDKTIPNGLAAMELQMTTTRKDEVIQKMHMKFEVQNFGTKAKSSLPDKK